MRRPRSASIATISTNCLVSESSGKSKTELRIASARSEIEIDDRLDQIAIDRGRETARVGAQNILAHGIMDLGGGARSSAAWYFGSERLSEHGLTHLRIEVFAKALIEFRAAALARLGKLDHHRFGNDRGRIGADIRDRLQQRFLILLGRARSVFPYAQRLSEHFGKSHPVFEHVIFEEIGPSRRAREAAANRQSGLGPGHMR